MKHFTNNGKEYLRKYDIPGQGKSKEQYESNMKALAFLIFRFIHSNFNYNL